MKINLNEYWTISLISGLLSFIPIFIVLYIIYFSSIWTPIAAGIGIILMLIQFAFVITCIVFQKKAQKIGDKRGVYGVILALVSIVPWILIFMYNVITR